MEHSAPTDSSTPESPERRHLPLTLVLVGGITLLILLAAGSVLFISLREATENTFSLLADKADSNLDLLEAQLETLLGPVENAGTGLAERIAAGDVSDTDTEKRLHDMLRGALAALPRSTAAVYVSASGGSVRMARINGRIAPTPENAFTRERETKTLARAREMNTPDWLEPVWIPALQEPVLTFLAPVHRDGELAGAVVIATRLGELATFLERIEKESGVRAFILYDGRYVLGHPEMLTQDGSLPLPDGTVALPTIEAFREDAFRLLASSVQRAEQLLHLADLHDAPMDDEYILLIREIHTYGDTPWQIALRFRQAEVTVELDRLRDSALVGVGILLIAVVAGYLFTRNLNRQIGRLADAATRLRNLDVIGLQPLPDSRLREMANAANAFNALIAAMRWFETYVPKALVLRLMRAGDVAFHSDERTLTILFSDIRGFSTLVEHMSPPETAEFLNEHFSLLAACIEAEGGTVDKFIGDSIMAFWGAPEDQPDHAARALRAAQAMCDAIGADNVRRHDAGLPEVQIRIGIHSGPVVVGNIGSSNRLNYTVIGDAVNVAARLENFGKELDVDAGCVIVFSGTTLAAGGGKPPDGTSTEHLGDVSVRGREGRVEAYRLIA